MAETVIRLEQPMVLVCFLGMLAAMTLWEALAPRRPQPIGRLRRWPNNLGLVALDIVAVRLVVPLTNVGMALLAQSQGWGLFNLLPVPGWIAGPVAVILLDLVIWGQHVMFHVVPLLWRLHRVHHADLAFDVTTGLRFHPIEILLSMAIKFAAIITLGAAPLAVLVFEVLLNTMSMFNHGNVRAPFDDLVRLVVVTPDMHRVHHSADRGETDSNFGFNLACWDRLFGTYRPDAALGQQGMMLGTDRFRDPRELRLDRMLWQPWRRDPPMIMAPGDPTPADPTPGKGMPDEGTPDEGMPDEGTPGARKSGQADLGPTGATAEPASTRQRPPDASA